MRAAEHQIYRQTKRTGEEWIDFIVEKINKSHYRDPREVVGLNLAEVLVMMMG